MRYSGLYFIPSHGNTPDASVNILSAIVNSIESHFEFATRQHPWSLLHRLLRSVPPPTPSNGAQPQPQSQSQSYQHILHLSYLSQGTTYCYVHPTTQNPNIKAEPTSRAANIKAEPTSQAPTPQPSHDTSTTPPPLGTIISIPASQSESHIAFLVNQFSPLWAFRHALQVPNGITYTAGQYIINIGEVRASRSGPSSSSNPISPGVVVCITTDAGASNNDDDAEFGRNDSGYTSLDGGAADEDAVDFEEVEAEVRTLWNMIRTGIDFGKAEVREVMMGKEGLEGSGEKEAVVRMWCEVLRLRA